MLLSITQTYTRAHMSLNVPSDIETKMATRIDNKVTLNIELNECSKLSRSILRAWRHFCTCSLHLN